MATDGANDSGWKKRESFGSAVVQIVIVALLLAAGVYFFYSKRNTQKEIADLMTEARQEVLKGNVANLKKALQITEEALAKSDKAGDPNAFAAAVYTDLWLLHGDASAEGKAKAYLEKAKAADAKTEDRYGTEALHLIAAGNFKGADDFIEELRKRGGSGARLFYAQGLALKGQGNLKLAAASLRAAVDKAWKDVNYAAAWGEELLEEGAPGAIDAFTKAAGQNPEHFRARLGLALARVQKRERLGDAENILKDLQAHKEELSAPQQARVLAIAAGIFNIQEQFDEAIRLADQALAMKADDVWALHAKATALAAKKSPQAAAAFGAVVAKAPASPVFYFEGAASLHRANQTEAAMALLSKYESFFKNVKNSTADGKDEIYLDRDDRYWLARGDFLKTVGKKDEAMAAYDKAIAAKAAHLTRAYYAKGALLLEKKELDKAVELLQDITPPDGTGQLAEAYAAMGDILFQKKEWGPGCQNYAFALTRMKATQAPREKLNELLNDVEKRLKSANQKEVAKMWVTEAKPLIQ